MVELLERYPVRARQMIMAEGGPGVVQGYRDENKSSVSTMLQSLVDLEQIMNILLGDE
jgi:hypothetical protein